MASIKKFEDINAWKEARELCKKISVYSNRPAFSMDTGLKKQVSDSSGSIMDNIAEGFERGGKKEFISFLGYAKGSAGELKSQLYRILDKGYINKSEFQESYDLADNIARMLSGLISYLKNCEHKGFKFHEDPEIYKTIKTKPKL